MVKPLFQYLRDEGVPRMRQIVISTETVDSALVTLAFLWRGGPSILEVAENRRPYNWAYRLRRNRVGVLRGWANNIAHPARSRFCCDISPKKEN